MEANEPNTTNQTSYILLNNELEKIQGRIDLLEEKIDNIATGIKILVSNVKELRNSSELKKPSMVDYLPDDDKLDVFEDHEGTCMDFSRVVDDQLSEKELEPFVEKKTLSKDIYNACLTDELLDAIDRKEMEDYINNVL